MKPLSNVCAASQPPPRGGAAAVSLPGIKIPATRHLLPVSVCVTLLDKSADQILQNIDSGAIDFAWNIARPGARRREIRIWRGSLMALVYQVELQPRSEDAVIDAILPTRDPKTTELQTWLSASQKHVQALVEEGELRPSAPPLTTRGPNAYTRIERASAAEFLRKRRLR